jgi:uncharacterized protein involved in exopolysaccharide biosynthesis
MRIPITDPELAWTLAAAMLSGGLLTVLVTLLRKGE